MGTFAQYRDGLIFAITPPAVQELGNATGFDLQLVDTGGIGHERLLQARNMMLGMAMQDKRLVGVRPNSLEDAPAQGRYRPGQGQGARARPLLGQQHHRHRLGRSYVNDFIDRGRVKRVYVQADAPIA
jgi:HAE1 family hydrophobic/amphiphilic exporter-1/multidrug efflux pump